MRIAQSVIIVLISLNLSAQTLYTQKDVDICDAKFEIALEKGLETKPIGEVMIEVGKSFLGTEYEAHTLEAGDKEELIVNLDGLDCYTFFESTLAISRCIKMGKKTFDDYLKEIENIRYRGGKMVDYPSRLHYTSDWIYDNEKRGIVSNMTNTIGGIPYDNRVYFMSENPDSYKFLKDNKENQAAIAGIEKDINSREYYYIPQDEIESLESRIESGDIIGITTDINGLDVSHTGIAIRAENGRVHFLHAPLKGHKVEITGFPLADYVKSNKHQTGIYVVRPLEPVK